MINCIDRTAFYTMRNNDVLKNSKLNNNQKNDNVMPEYSNSLTTLAFCGKAQVSMQAKSEFDKREITYDEFNQLKKEFYVKLYSMPDDIQKELENVKLNKYNINIAMNIVTRDIPHLNEDRNDYKCVSRCTNLSKSLNAITNRKHQELADKLLNNPNLINKENYMVRLQPLLELAVLIPKILKPEQEKLFDKFLSQKNLTDNFLNHEGKAYDDSRGNFKNALQIISWFQFPRTPMQISLADKVLSYKNLNQDNFDDLFVCAALCETIEEKNSLEQKLSNGKI